MVTMFCYGEGRNRINLKSIRGMWSLQGQAQLAAQQQQQQQLRDGIVRAEGSAGLQPTNAKQNIDSGRAPSARGCEDMRRMSDEGSIGEKSVEMGLE